MTQPITYTLRFPAPATHYVEVEALVPTDGRAQIELMLAVWTPGSYLVREYARHLERVEARSPDGDTLRGREDAQEPLARGVRRSGRGRRDVPACTAAR